MFPWIVRHLELSTLSFSLNFTAPSNLKENFSRYRNLVFFFNALNISLPSLVFMVSEEKYVIIL
jgi:hypothetical protein